MNINDLISREALKKKFERLVDETIPYGGVAVNDMRDLINNAPTVDIKDEIAGAYNEGYMCGNKEAEKARPQGEWIRTGSLGNGNSQYECSNCHYGDEQAESQEVPYCWHCGAKMQKVI